MRKGEIRARCRFSKIKILHGGEVVMVAGTLKVV